MFLPVWGPKLRVFVNFTVTTLEAALAKQFQLTGNEKQGQVGKK